MNGESTPDRRYDQLPSGSPYHEYVRSTADFTYAFKNVTADPTGNTAGTPIRMDLTVQDRANKDSEKYRLFFQIVPEDFGDAPPVVDILTPEAVSYTHLTLPTTPYV